MHAKTPEEYLIELDAESETADPRIELLWLEEAKRSLAEFDDGLADCIPLEDVVAEVSAELDRR